MDLGVMGRVWRLKLIVGILIAVNGLF